MSLKNIGLCFIYHILSGFHSINVFWKISMDQALFPELVHGKEPKKHRPVLILWKSRIGRGGVRAMSPKLGYASFAIERCWWSRLFSGTLMSGKSKL